jgi:hypothetical protein
MKSVLKLRRSPYHQQLGRKMCAAFVAQQQGVALETALRKVPDPVADVWLVVAEFAREASMQNTEIDLGELAKKHTGLIM